MAAVNRSQQMWLLIPKNRQKSVFGEWNYQKSNWRKNRKRKSTEGTLLYLFIFIVYVRQLTLHGVYIPIMYNFKFSSFVKI